MSSLSPQLSVDEDSGLPGGHRSPQEHVFRAVGHDHRTSIGVWVDPDTLMKPPLLGEATANLLQ